MNGQKGPSLCATLKSLRSYNLTTLKVSPSFPTSLSLPHSSPLLHFISSTQSISPVGIFFAHKLCLFICKCLHNTPTPGQLNDLYPLQFQINQNCFVINHASEKLSSSANFNSYSGSLLQLFEYIHRSRQKVVNNLLLPE